MSFDPLRMFTSAGTPASVWLFVALASLSFWGARRVLQGPAGRSLHGTVVGALLTLACVVSCLVLIAWLVNHHT